MAMPRYGQLNEDDEERRAMLYGLGDETPDPSAPPVSPTTQSYSPGQDKAPSTGGVPPSRANDVPWWERGTVGPGENTNVTNADTGATRTNAPTGTPPLGGSGASGGSGGGNAWAQYGTGNIPGAEGMQWGDPSRMRGYNTNAWGNTTDDYDSETIKNVFGMIASRYPPRPSSIPLILADPDFQRYFAGATQADFDKIDFGFGNGPMDVGVGFDPNTDSGEGWGGFGDAPGVPGATMSPGGEGGGEAGGEGEAPDQNQFLDDLLPMLCVEGGADQEDLLANLLREIRKLTGQGQVL